MEHVGFEAFYREEHARVLGVVTAVTGRADLAGEAADEAFARALARWSRVSKMAAPGAWTAKVALNVVRRTLRSASRERALLGSQAAAAGATPDPDLWALVRALPPRQRAAVVLRYVGDFTHAEIARHARATRHCRIDARRRTPQPARAARQ